jgi:hypothetical protein
MLPPIERLTATSNFMGAIAYRHHDGTRVVVLPDGLNAAQTEELWQRGCEQLADGARFTIVRLDGAIDAP